MTAPKHPQIRDHFLDSGPLFCLGASRILAEIFDAYLLPKAKVVAAVVGEVTYNANLVLPAVGHHKKRAVKQAARVVRGRYKTLIDGARTVPTPEPDLLARMKADLRTQAEAKLEPGEVLHPLKNDGEAESVYWAVTESVDVISNDWDAHRLAARHNVRSSSFVEVARHFVRDQKTIKRRDVYNELVSLSRRNIHPGEHLTNELDLV